MRKSANVMILVLGIAVLLAGALLIQGCGGGGRTGFSAVSGTVSDINRDVLVGADVWVDSAHQTKSLVSGTYRIQGAQSGWRTVWAEATVNGELWIGSTAAEILADEPTMNINIVLAPERDTTTISGTVRDDTGTRVERARVLLTTRIVSPPSQTGSGDGPYGSMVAVTDSLGRYILRDVPVDYDATIAASKVGFRNSEIAINTGSVSNPVDFALVESNLTTSPGAPELTAIESWTMPDTISRSGSSAQAYKAIKAYASANYRKALAGKKQVVTRSTRATPVGSLIEIDLYFNALDVNYSYNIAGYGIYRTTSLSTPFRAIDFVRDPYANFYGDTGTEITPDLRYYYRLTAVDVQFLDQNNNPDPASESDFSNYRDVVPLGQLQAGFPSQGGTTSNIPVFSWVSLPGASSYSIYVYDSMPTLPLDPDYSYPPGDPALFYGTLPIWHETGIGAGTSSIPYGGPALSVGHTYYWVILAQDSTGSAYSYGPLRNFTVR